MVCALPTRSMRMRVTADFCGEPVAWRGARNTTAFLLKKVGAAAVSLAGKLDDRTALHRADEGSAASVWHC